MAEHRTRPPSRLFTTQVQRSVLVTPRLMRVTAGGEDLAGFVDTGTDQHVKLYFYDDPSRLPRPLTLDLARSLRPRVVPVMRDYTIRRYDAAAAEVDIDVVLHGQGIAAGWAARAAPGDELLFVGPAQGYRPDPDVAGHLLVGDETALPAIAATLESLPSGVTARVVVEIADGAERQPLPERFDVDWVVRGATRLLDVVAGLTLPTSVHTWIATEGAQTRAIRTHLLADRGLPRRLVHATAYWRRGSAGG